MGRVRRSQRQSARLWYENHDHREIILNGEYINAVYVPSEHTYMDKDVAWRKYKKLTLLAGANLDSESQLVSVDVFNKFVSFSRAYDGFDEYPRVLGDSVVACSGNMSKNGYDYKYFDPNGSNLDYTPYRFAKSYMYEYQYDRQTFKHTLRLFGCSWNTGSQYASVTNAGTIEMTDGEHIANLNPCGEARDGLFASRTWTTRIGTQYPYTYHHYIEVYKITTNGFSLVYSDDYIDSSVGMSRLYPTNIYSHGNQYCGVTTWYNSQSQGVRLWVSNNGDTWQYYDLFNETPWALHPNMVIVMYRNNKWYFYVHMRSNNNLWRYDLYTATDLLDPQTFQLIPLPDYLDIPMLGYEDGIHGDIDDCDGMYARIILNSYDGNIPAEQGDTIYMYPSMGRYANGSYDYRYFSINDGHMNYDPPNNYMCGYESEYDSEADMDCFNFFYIDNMTFQSSSNNFAFRKWQSDDPWSQENHEVVADDDYVWGNNNA